MFSGGWGEEPGRRPGSISSGWPAPYRSPYTGEANGQFVSMEEVMLRRDTPPSFPVAPPPQEPRYEEVEASNNEIEGLWSLVVEGTGPLRFFVEDGIVYEQIAYSSQHGGESQPQVYKSYTGREEKKTKYGQARADAYREMSPQVRTTLDNKIAEQLRIIRSEQSLFNRATWNRANQQMPNPQVQPKGGQPQPMSGVTYDFDRAPSQQQRNVQWGSTPDAMLLSYTSNVQDIYNFMHPGMKFRPRKRNLQKRTSVLDEIEGSTSKGNSTVSQTAEFQVYLNAYRTVQANISNLIFPFFDTVINGTNNSLIYDIVWSVYSDLTNSGPQIIGPFSYGRHCFDWMEEAYLNSTRNSTSSHTSSNSSANGTDVKDPVYQQMLATHYQLIEIYSYVWSNASAIANQTGLLRDLVIFQKYLAPADPSIMSQDWTSAQTNFDNSYFTAYNKTH